MDPKFCALHKYKNDYSKVFHSVFGQRTINVLLATAIVRLTGLLSVD